MMIEITTANYKVCKNFFILPELGEDKICFRNERLFLQSIFCVTIS
jgi:hypothetical protein